MTLASIPAIDVTLLPALLPMCHLVHRTYHFRQQNLLTRELELDPEAAARIDQAAAEHSVGLFLQVVEPMYNSMPDEQVVSLTERLGLALSALDGLTRASTPADICRPTLSNQAQRVCIVPVGTARLVVQATLAVALAALADAALQIVITMPRAGDDGVCIEVESDTAGIASSAQHALYARVDDALRSINGQLTVEPRQQSTIARIWIPRTAILRLPLATLNAAPSA